MSPSLSPEPQDVKHILGGFTFIRSPSRRSSASDLRSRSGALRYSYSAGQYCLVTYISAQQKDEKLTTTRRLARAIGQLSCDHGTCMAGSELNLRRRNSNSQSM